MEWVNNRINCHFIFLIMINSAYFSITFPNARPTKPIEAQNSKLLNGILEIGLQYGLVLALLADSEMGA